MTDEQVKLYAKNREKNQRNLDFQKKLDKGIIDYDYLDTILNDYDYRCYQQPLIKVLKDFALGIALNLNEEAKSI